MQLLVCVCLSEINLCPLHLSQVLIHPLNVNNYLFRNMFQTQTNMVLDTLHYYLSCIFLIAYRSLALRFQSVRPTWFYALRALCCFSLVSCSGHSWGFSILVFNSVQHIKTKLREHKEPQKGLKSMLTSLTVQVQRTYQRMWLNQQVGVVSDDKSVCNKISL